MKSFQARPWAVIFDIGDVLWHRYECGEITRDVCYELTSQQFSLPASEIAEAFAQARRSLQPDHDVVSFIRDLKKDGSIKLYAMSNIGKEDFDELVTKEGLPGFDRVFTSAAAGMRKPDLGFYRHVLDQTGLVGSQVIFIDDKQENIQAAQTLGIQGLVFGPTTVHNLREMFCNPVGRGWRYLVRNAPQCESVTNTGVSFADNFSKLLIADILQDQTLTDLTWGAKSTWNFFHGEAVLIPGGYFPDDLDTTSLALKVFRPPAEIVSPILDTMKGYVNDDGI